MILHVNIQSETYFVGLVNMFSEVTFEIKKTWHETGLKIFFSVTLEDFHFEINHVISII